MVTPAPAEEAAVAEWTGKGLYQTRVQTGGHSFLMDEPVTYGGLGSGPNPFDLLRSALAGCTLMTLKLYAERKGWNLDRIRVRVTHQKGAHGAPDRFDRVLELGDATDEQREALLKIALRCPVHLLLERGAEVTVALGDASPGPQSPTPPDAFHGSEAILPASPTTDAGSPPQI